jgi:hypothetical protein
MQYIEFMSQCHEILMQNKIDFLEDLSMLAGVALGVRHRVRLLGIIINIIPEPHRCEGYVFILKILGRGGINFFLAGARVAIANTLYRY